MLSVEKLSAGYGPHLVLHDVSLSVPEGRIVALIGANGAGKSTLARTLTGLLPARSGRVLLAGRVVTELSPPERLRLGLAEVPEGRQVFAGLTVGDNLRLGAYGVRRAVSPRGIKERIEEVLALFPALAGRMGHLAGNLSGGQQQMLAIGRALMSRPRALVLDEPSLGLAPLLVADIFRLIRGLSEHGLAILLSEQNARQSLAIADYGYVLERGTVVLDGPAGELAGRPEVAERYLGLGAAAFGRENAARSDLAPRLKDLLHLDEAPP